MNITRNIILTLVVVAYFANSYVLYKVYPNVSTDYVEFTRFYYTRNVVYEFMFLSCFVVSFLGGDRLTKAISCFGMIVTAGSLIDKAVFKITNYLVSDVALVLLSVVVSIYIYARSDRRN